MLFSQLNLDNRIFKAINLCGYTTPTPIQARCIPDILQGKDLIASAQTGTGKTAAFVLPALQRISLTQSKSRKPRVLILTPTRELASQNTKAVNKYGKFLSIKLANLVGGVPYRQQIRDLSRNVDIVIATPGRLLDHLQCKRVDLSGIEILILDEADRMLDMGFIDDVKKISQATPKNRQTLLFSATIDKRLSQTVKYLLKDPVRIDLSQETIAPSKIEQKLFLVDNTQHKFQLLTHFCANEAIFKAIIFSATKINADRLAVSLCKQGYNAAALHGDLKQNKRNQVVEKLRHGKIQFLVATDVAARGIDIADISHVINYDLPKFYEDYVHRIGRTGRAGKSGVAISFVSPSEVHHVKKIEWFINQPIKTECIEGLEPKTKPKSAAKSKSTKSHKPATKGKRKFKKDPKFSQPRKRKSKPKHKD